MLVSIAVALLAAADPAARAETPEASASTPVEVASAPAEDEEICRRVTVVDYGAPGGRKSTKVCKTRDEWKDYMSRRR